jgi:hypothetical protein
VDLAARVGGKAVKTTFELGEKIPASKSDAGPSGLGVTEEWAKGPKLLNRTSSWTTWEMDIPAHTEVVLDVDYTCTTRTSFPRTSGCSTASCATRAEKPSGEPIALRSVPTAWRPFRTQSS